MTEWYSNALVLGRVHLCMWFVRLCLKIQKSYNMAHGADMHVLDTNPDL